MTKEILADRIKQLINISQALLNYCNKFKELHDKFIPSIPLEKNKYLNSEIPMLLRFLQTSFFYDALLNINTILAPLQQDPNKKEQSIFELIELESDTTKKTNLLTEAKKIRTKLEAENLHKWRHKLVGHKDLENAGDTEIMYLKFIKDEFIEYSKELLQDTEKLLISNYDIFYNNTFEQLYSKSFEKMIELFEIELQKM